MFQRLVFIVRRLTNQWSASLRWTCSEAGNVGVSIVLLRLVGKPRRMSTDIPSSTPIWSTLEPTQSTHYAHVFIRFCVRSLGMILREETHFFYENINTLLLWSHLMLLQIYNDGYLMQWKLFTFSFSRVFWELQCYYRVFDRVLSSCWYK